jgi:hypothetical protein
MEKAVCWRVFHLTVQEIRQRNADLDPDELQRIIDETVSEVRVERYARRRLTGSERTPTATGCTILGAVAG